MAESSEVGVRGLLAVGLTLICLALVAHGIIVINNVGYISHYFGWPVLLAYLAAATGLVVLPWAVPYLHAPRVTKTVLVAFCSWLTLEENLHAASGWRAPAGAMSVLEVFFKTETAKGISLLAFVLIVYFSLEIIAHMGHCGLHMCRSAQGTLAHKSIKRK